MFLEKLFRSGSLENPSTTVAEAVTGGTLSDAGANVTVETATTLSAVWQAITMISGDVSKLPLYVYRRGANDSRQIDDAHPAARLIRVRPNAEISALKLWRRAMVHALLFGNAYIWIERVNGLPVGLYNLLPERTYPVRIARRLTVVTEVSGELVGLNADDVLHIEGACWDNLAAPSLVVKARHDFGLQLQARGFTSRYFGNGLHNGGILQVPETTNAKKRQQYEERLVAKAKNPANWFKTLVLKEGYKWIQTASTLKDAETNALDETKTRDVARWYNLSPDRLGLPESSSYNSLEQRRRDYQDSTLSYWLCQIVAECNLKLLSETEIASGSKFVDYLIQALLWADSATVANIGTQGVQAGWLTKNEIRAWMNLNPLPKSEGDQ